MRRMRLLFVFAIVGSFFACAESSSPNGATEPTDASADRNVKKDSGPAPTGDSAVEEDTGTKKDAGKDVVDTDVDTTDADTTDADTTDADTSDTSVTDTGTTDTGTDAGPCNDLVYGTAELTMTSAGGTKPTQTGGTPADGTYDLTAYQGYPTAIGSYKLRSTIRIQGNKIAALRTLNGSEVRASGTFSVSGKDITISWTCVEGTLGSTETGDFTFTGDAGAGTLSYFQSSLVYEARYTKQ